MPPVNWDLKRAKIELSIAQLDSAHAEQHCRRLEAAGEAVSGEEKDEAIYRFTRLQLVESLARKVLLSRIFSAKRS